MVKGGEIRRYRRFKGWDYTKGASLFITIATEPRRSLFGRVVDGKVVLSEFGRIVQEALESMPRLNPGLLLFGYVVMPDHIHFNCALSPGLDEPLKVLGWAIRRFKNYTTAWAKHSLAINARSGNLTFSQDGQTFSRDGQTVSRDGQTFSRDGQTVSRDGQTVSRDGQTLSQDGQTVSHDGQTVSHDGQTVSHDGQTVSRDGQTFSRDGQTVSRDGQTVFGLSSTLWQQGYHDYILVSREMIDSTERYIAYNPMKWELMYGENGALRVIEPLFLPRLDAGDYWKGVGNLSLLDPTEKLVSLRVSREVATPTAIAAVVRRMESAVDKGYVVISGFISKGERAVRDMLCRRPDARFIRMLPSCIPNRRFKPESAYVTPFAEGRYLELGRGNDEVEFGRGACLDINAEIIEIATAGEGLALYWKGDGPHVLAEHSSAINTGGGL